MNILTRQIMVGSLAFVILGLFSTGILEAQDERRRGRGGERFDAIRYLERADRDNNGTLDARELGGRLKEYVSELGIDTSRPVPIQKIKRAYEAKKKNEADAERMKTIDANRQVSKFGTDETLVPPPDFSVENLAGQNGRLEDKFDEEMVQTVKAYMRRYDENKDGSLDSNESRRIRRGAAIRGCSKSRYRRTNQTTLGINAPSVWRMPWQFHRVSPGKLASFHFAAIRTDGQRFHYY